jgi:hypothetical protein
MPSGQSVFLSSTKRDLVEHRAAVVRALLDNGFHPIDMDNFMARDEEPLEACLQEVNSADVFVGIYAWRYGFIPEGSRISITEQELLEAERAGKPCFCFFVDEGHPWPDALRESGEGERLLQELKARIGARRVIATFTTPENLAGKVGATLHRHAPKTAVSPERRALLLLLDKVEGSWLEKVLETSAPEERRIALELEERAGAVESPLGDWQEAPAAPAPLSEATIVDLFLERERSLLILGEPGSGKTTTLLLLAQGLALRARRNPEEPIPVVFHLSSWNERRTGLGEWLTQELAARYQVGGEAARSWLQGHQILPLLDGLDEVDPEHRAACVSAVNAYLADHGLWGMALCCRTQVCEELPQRLRLSTAVAVRPLTPAKVEEYLASTGAEGEDLRAALSGNEVLQELSRSPQLLSLLAQTWHGSGPEALTPGSFEDRKKKLFSAYVDLRLRKRPSRRYPPERTLRSLAWLASRMKERGSSLFQLEQLQPSWLSAPAWRWLYALATRTLAGGLLVLPLVGYWPAGLILGVGLLAGALAGAADALGLGKSVAAGLPGGVRSGLRRSAAHVAGFGIGAFLLFNLFNRLAGSESLTPDEVLLNSLFGGLQCALVLGLVLGLRSSQRDGSNDIRVTEALIWSGWSWKGMRKGALGGLLLSLALLAIHTLGSLIIKLWPFGLPLLILLVAGLMSTGAVGGGLVGGLRGRVIEKKSLPNQGIWLTLRNTGVLALVVALAASLGVETIVLALWGFAKLQGAGGVLRAHLWTPVFLGGMLGVWIGLWFSGLDFLQHFVLRALLRLRGNAPARFVRFLDHAVERGLLHKVGGSYLFFHGQPLLDHFASLPDPPIPRPLGE